MKVKEIIRELEAELITGSANLEKDVQSACGADLMSDVMAFVKESGILLTGLVNLQVIRTAEMMDIEVIVFVRGKDVTPAMIALAEEKGITLLKTRYPMFIACGKLYASGLTRRGGRE